MATSICYDWPDWNWQLLWVVLAFAAGLALVWLIERLAGKRRSREVSAEKTAGAVVAPDAVDADALTCGDEE